MTNFDNLLKAAFEAGADLARYDATTDTPDFEEWRATLSGLDTSEDLGPIAVGDTVTILRSAPDHLERWRGRTCRVYLTQDKMVYVNVPEGRNGVTSVAVPRMYVARAGA